MSRFFLQVKNMNKWKSIADIRREYGNLQLNESDMPDEPLHLFEQWFDEVLLTEKSDPTAMVLSSVDDRGYPDSRVVLLKGIDEGRFVFFTNYQSAKAQQLSHTPYAALNFYWPQMVRQVRIRGRVKQVSQEQSDAYFASRPYSSQLSAYTSPQSQEIKGREELEQRLNQIIAKYQQQTVMRPEFWGGYEVLPDEMEFWQGRDNRLHDRIHYYLNHNRWEHRRLAP